MLSKETKKRIDNARDTLVGVLPLPTDQIELITIALIYKFMDDQDEELRQVGFDEKFFKGDLKEYSWQQLMSNQIDANQRVTKFINGIDQIQKAKDIPELFKEIFQNAFLKFRDGKVLQRFLDIINGFTYSHSEELGNAFEYLLMTMGAQGDNGQFRTPRNVIDFIVDIVNPLKTDTILDPACGTGGFLVSAFKHILRTNTKGYENSRLTTNGIDEEKLFPVLGDKLTTIERNTVEKNISGYDNTPLMVRLARVNLYLHHFNNPKIHEYNTLNNDGHWKERFDCILANPPFMTPKGGIDPHDKFRIQANRTEILFSSYILQHLNSEKGKAGFIIPEGIIFTTSRDYVALRKWLLYEAGLWAVISLPAGVFQPYSGVKTSILLIDKEIARNRKEVLLVKIHNDGFSLNTNRNPINSNDLPEALGWLQLCKTNKEHFVEQLEKRKDEKFTEQLQFLDREEFAKLDAYKSSSSALSFVNKLHEQTIKIKINTEEQIEIEKKGLKELKKDPKKKETVENKIDKLQERIDKKIQNFYKLTGINFLPDTIEALKIWFDENIKADAIEYGTTLKSKKLFDGFKQYLDNQREFNLSFERYNLTEEFKNSIFPLVKLKDLLKIQTGFAFNSKLFNNEGKGFPILRIRDIKKGFSETFYSGEYDESFIVNQGDILIGMDGEFKAYKWGKQPALLNQRVCRLHSFKNVVDDYIFRFLNEELFAIEQKTFGVTVKHISHSQIYAIEIPLPPIELQQKIAAEIEQYQKIIDGCDLLIENYKPSFEIKEYWEMIELGEVGKICMCKRIFKEQTTDKGDVPFYKIGTFGSQPDSYISKELFEEYKTKFSYPKKGDILLSTSGTIGKIVVFDGKPAYFQDSNIVWIANDETKVLNEFLKIVFQIIKWQPAESVTIARLYNGIIEKTKIPIPSISEQQNIVDEYLKERSTINGAKELKVKMQHKIKEVIDKVWGR